MKDGKAGTKSTCLVISALGVVFENGVSFLLFYFRQHERVLTARLEFDLWPAGPPLPAVALTWSTTLHSNVIRRSCGALPGPP